MASRLGAVTSAARLRLRKTPSGAKLRPITELCAPRKGDKMSDLKKKVEDWLGTQGYPLEFATAAAFRQHGFDVQQGTFARDPEEGISREIDILASMTERGDSSVVRVYFVVECKWSIDKPWVVFVAPGGMSPAACVAQTVGDKAARMLLWAKAGDKDLQSIGLFQKPDLAGFGGRQALSEKKDVFYEAIQSITSATLLWSQNYDRVSDPPTRALKHAVVLFPLVVVKGSLFQASYDGGTQGVAVAECDSARVYWKGLPKWGGTLTVDIVKADALPGFLEQRRLQVQGLISKMQTALAQLRKAFTEKDIDLFKVTEAVRGVGRPPLFRELEEFLKTKAAGSVTDSPQRAHNKPLKVGRKRPPTA
jgi:hypothetical protein